MLENSHETTIRISPVSVRTGHAWVAVRVSRAAVSSSTTPAPPRANSRALPRCVWRYDPGTNGRRGHQSAIAAQLADHRVVDAVGVADGRRGLRDALDGAAAPRLDKQ